MLIKVQNPVACLAPQLSALKSLNLEDSFAGLYNCHFAAAVELEMVVVAAWIEKVQQDAEIVAVQVAVKGLLFFYLKPEDLLFASHI